MYTFKNQNSLELAKFSSANDVLFNSIIPLYIRQNEQRWVDNVSNEHRTTKPDDGDAIALDYACLNADERSVLAGCQI